MRNSAWSITEFSLAQRRSDNTSDIVFRINPIGQNQVGLFIFYIGLLVYSLIKKCCIGMNVIHDKLSVLNLFENKCKYKL